MTISFTKRNGRTYAYRCTSKRVAGKKNPVCVKQYLGVLDENTGEIVPKKVDPVNRGNPLIDGAISIKDHGNVLIAYAVAKELGIISELEQAFGECSKELLSMVIAKTIDPVRTSDLHLTFQSSTIEGIVGLERRMGRCAIRDAMSKIDAQGIERFLSEREKRHRGRVMIFDTPLWASEQYSFAGGGFRNSQGSNIIVSTDELGRMISYKFHFGMLSYPSTISNVFIRTDELKDRSIMVTEENEDDPDKVLSMIRHDIEFVSICQTHSSTMRMLVNGLDGCTDRDVRIHRGRKYIVQEVRLGLVNIDRRWRYVSEHEPQFDSSSIRVNAFVCRNVAVNKGGMKILKDGLDNMMRVIDESDQTCPSDVISKEIVMDSKFVKDSGGSGQVRIDRDAVSSIRSELGSFVILSSFDSWDLCMEYGWRRIELMNKIDRFRAEANRSFMTGENIRTINSTLFIQFLVETIYDEMERKMEMNGLEGMSVNGLLKLASSYRNITCDGKRIPAGKSEGIRDLMELFDVDDSLEEKAQDGAPGIESEEI